MAAQEKSQAKFQDSVLDAASGAGAFLPFSARLLPARPRGPGLRNLSASQAPAGMETEEVDPIAEADVYMAYGRDAQAEEILKEALAKDASRVTVALQAPWRLRQPQGCEVLRADRAEAEGIDQRRRPPLEPKPRRWDARSIRKTALYGGAGGAAPAAAAPAPAAAAPTLDFDLGGATQSGKGPDITFDAAPKAEASIDFDLGAAASAPAAPEQPSDFTPEGTLIMDHKGPDSTGLELRPGPAHGRNEGRYAAPARGARGCERRARLRSEPGTSAAGSRNPPAGTKGRPSRGSMDMDLSSISLDLGGAGDLSASGGGADPKWQEVATKLDSQGLRGNGRQGRRSRASQRGDEGRRRRAEGAGAAAAREGWAKLRSTSTPEAAAL